MECPKCQSNSTAVAKMALSGGLNLGTGIMLNASVLSLAGPKPLQPDWLFYAVGAAIVGIGLFMGYLFNWELAGFWGMFLATGIAALAWPLAFRKFRQNRLADLKKHQEFIESNWFCSSCGHIWPRA